MAPRWRRTAGTVRSLRLPPAPGTRQGCDDGSGKTPGDNIWRTDTPTLRIVVLDPGAREARLTQYPALERVWGPMCAGRIRGDRLRPYSPVITGSGETAYQHLHDVLKATEPSDWP